MDPMKILVNEHIIIQKVLKVTKTFTKNFKHPTTTTDLFLNSLIDFFRVFADQTHHGKEEAIYFKKLEDKPLKVAEKKILAELFQEHILARNFINTLEKEKASPITTLDQIFQLYHDHILKENTQFFLPTFTYFSSDEKAKMVLDFYESDQKTLQGLFQEFDQKLNSLIS